MLTMPNLRISPRLLVWIFALLEAVRSTHIFTLDEDFSKVKTDKDLANHVGQVLKRLDTFKVSVHPRIWLLYRLLKRGMADYAHRTADTLYTPHVYKQDHAYNWN